LPAQQATKHQAVQSFFELLVLATRGTIRVAQPHKDRAREHADIAVAATPALAMALAQ
jgi:hypothetical protein